MSRSDDWRARTAADGQSDATDRRLTNRAVAIVILGAMVAAPVLAVGGVHETVQTRLLVAFTASFVVFSLYEWWTGRHLLWHPISLVTAVFAMLAWLQSLPLPIGIVDVLSPRAAEATREAVSAFGQRAEWASLSLDRDASLQAARLWTLYTVAVLLACQCLRSRRVQRAVPWLLVGLGGTVVAVGIVQLATGTGAIYGLVTPRHASAVVGAGGPFINPNHCGHFLLLVASVILALSTQSRSRRRLVPLMLVFTSCLGMMLLAGARGSLASLLIVAVGYSAVVGPKRWSGFGTGVVVCVLAVAVIALVCTDTVSVGEQLRDSLDASKLELQGAAATLLGDFAITGVGAHAFGAIQVALLPLDLPTPHHLAYVENDYLQLLLDFGVVIPALVAVAILTQHRRRKPSRQSRSGIWRLAVLPFALNSLVDFALPVAGLMLPVLVLYLARIGSLRPLSFGRPGRRAAVIVVMTGTTLGLLATPTDVSDGPTDRQTVIDQAGRAPLDGRSVWKAGVDAVENAVELPIAEIDGLAERAAELAQNDGPLLAALGRYWLTRRDMSRAAALFNRALAAQPWLRRATGGWIISQGDPQAWLEVCEASLVVCHAALETLLEAGRYGELLVLALGLPDSARVVYYRILAARELAEPELVSGFVEQIARLSPSGAESCRLRAEGLLVGRRLSSGLDALAACVGRFPDDQMLLERYAAWSLSTLETAAATRATTDLVLAELNLSSAADAAARRRYHRLRAMAQARDGLCRAALVSLELARAASGEPVHLPAWVYAACPELDVGEAG